METNSSAMKASSASYVARERRWLILFSLGIIAYSAWFLSPAAQGATFDIEEILVHDDPTVLHEGITVAGLHGGKSSNPEDQNTFVPQIEVVVRTSKDFRSNNIFARAYFYDDSSQRIQEYQEPSIALHQVTDGVRSNTNNYVWPTVLPQDQRQTIYFPLPNNLPDNWKVVIVFGTNSGAVATVYPDGDEKDFNYPEQQLVERTALDPDRDIADADPLPTVIEEKVESDNPKYPAFTLLLHLPHGVTDPKQVSGVLAICLVANSVGAMRDQLNAIRPQNDPNLLYAYAESHNLAILAWGARWVWDSYANFDEMDQTEARESNDDFEKLASAWDQGVQHLVEQYGIPDHGYLMYGLSAGGVWVHRLALHKPDRFQAVCMHIADSYDAPTPEGSQIQWLLTTGELDGGYDKAQRFYAAARALNYPIIFKAFIGLGHGQSPLADRLAVDFFDYVLSNEPKSSSADDTFATSSQVDLSGYISPPYYGDLMNQDMYPADQKDMIPPGFLVPLPTQAIADAWNKQ